MDVNEVFEGLAANASVVPGLRAYPFMPDAVTPPVMAPMDVEITYDRTMARGVDELSVRCLLLVSRATDRAGQRHLNELLAGSGPRSIKSAIESDRRLGGTCMDLNVTRVSGYGQFEHGGGAFYGAELHVRVIGKGA